ncbi:lysophospholipase, partial [Phenoliferia sp. Uapishka_3]
MPSSTSSDTRADSREAELEMDKLEGGKDLEKHGSGASGISRADVQAAELPKLKYIPFVGRKQPREPYDSIEDAPMLPLASANIFSKWTYWWIQPLLIVGAQRTLQPKDLWKLPEEMESGFLADKLMENFDRRKAKVEAWNKALEDGSYKPNAVKKVWWKVRGKDGRKKIGLAGALSDTFFYEFWSAGVIKVVGDVAQVTSPLVTKALINFATESYYSHRGIPGYTLPPVGKGIGLAFALWAMQIISSLSIHQFFVRSAGTGVLARGALIASIYRRSLVLSGKARTVITNGKLVNHISTDVSRIDFCAGFFHMSWTAPIQLTIIVVILLVNLGPSCLAGIAFLLIMLFVFLHPPLHHLPDYFEIHFRPPQSYAMKSMFAMRRKAMVWTDKRAKLIQELLGGMRVIKFFAWEVPYLAKLNEIRRAELYHVRGLLTIRAANTAIAMSLPMLATVIAFLTYAGTGHRQTPAIIFTSLTLFNLLRMPLMMLPMSLSTITDAHNALGRLTEVFLAEERSGTFKYDSNSSLAIEVTDADFQWEGMPPETAPKTKKEQTAIVAKAKAEKKADKLIAKKALRAGETPTDPEVVVGNTDEGRIVGAGEIEEAAGEPETLQLQGINLAIPKGQLCAIVGSVGSGKSSLLQALVGEMKRTRGEVTFGGSIAYCSQQAWIQNCTLKENILFGQPLDEARYQQVIHDACLDADLAMLPYGDLTEIGEKGITLSGGQKQRVNIARALYFNADIILLDDPLSAVDAHVGKHLFDNAICGSLAGKTRVLVTHALHFLHQVDYILCIEHGKLLQQGTYDELIADTTGAFAELVRDFGGGAQEKKEEDEEKALDGIEDAEKGGDEKPKVDQVAKKGKALMQEEERATGAVSGQVYGKFFRAAKGHITVPLLVTSLFLMQGSQVLAVILVGYFQCAKFYRESAREIKRLDNFLRSSLYAHFSESLSGLATIRAYGEDPKFLKQNETFINIENRAYYLSVVNQRWLGFRLDMFGGLLTAIVAFMGVGGRFTISPSQTGLILSYILTIQQAFSWMVRQGAEVENDMNSVERLVHYADELEREAPAVIEGSRPPSEWPAHGAIELKKVVMSYRVGLPPVLKGLSLSVGAGEKIGVVGRTGAGKSSIMMALFRIVELTSGSIEIDGLDIAKMGLADLRDKIAIIPQDALLFNGTIRTNLDPFGVYPDAVLWEALKRAWLVDREAQLEAAAKAPDDTVPTTPANRFSLDLAIDDEGLNLSVGERSLVSLARALVKDARIIVLDEATASVDLATDSRIQETIRKEFKSKTLLCIAHRLRTIINYDKVLVMDQGELAEFDTPINLFRLGDAPSLVDCPEDLLITRTGSPLTVQSLDAGEAAYIKNRSAEVTAPIWTTYLDNADLGTTGYDTATIVNAVPRVSIAVSGGGYRAALFGASTVSALDRRNDTHVAPLLQLADYISGLSGGTLQSASSPTDACTHQLVLGDSDFDGIQFPRLRIDVSLPLTNTSAGWKMDLGIWEPASLVDSILTDDDSNYHDHMKADVQKKASAEFPVSIIDLWGRALSYHFFNGTTRSNFFDDVEHDSGLLWSSVKYTTKFQSNSMPLPIIVTTSTVNDSSQGGFSEAVSKANTQFEITPYTFGSFDHTLMAHIPTEYAGSDLDNGLNANSSSCVNGYDSAGFILGSSAALFNVADKYASYLDDILNPIEEVYDDLEDRVTSVPLVANWPNPFKNYATTFESTGNDILELTDGGENGENIPIGPLLVKARAQDVIFAIDGSADTNTFPLAGFPDGGALLGTADRVANHSNGFTSFPPVPADTDTFVSLGFTDRPTFFVRVLLSFLHYSTYTRASSKGCNTVGNGDTSVIANYPIVVYMANARTGDDNILTDPVETTTIKFDYSVEDQLAFLEAGQKNALKGYPSGTDTSDADWPLALKCALVDRARKRAGLTRSDACTTQFARCKGTLAADFMLKFEFSDAVAQSDCYDDGVTESAPTATRMKSRSYAYPPPRSQ